MVAFGNRLWGNEVVMTYLRTGEFRHWAPIRKVTRWTVGAGPRRRVPDARRGACGAAAGAEPRALPRTRAGSPAATSSASTTTPGAGPAQLTSVTLRSDSSGRCLNRLMGRSRRGIIGLSLSPTNKGPKGLADMGCAPQPAPEPPPSRRCAGGAAQRGCTLAAQCGPAGCTPDTTACCRAGGWGCLCRLAPNPAPCSAPQAAHRMAGPQTLWLARRPGVPAEPVQGDLVRVHARRARVHPRERHALQGGRQPPLRLDQRLPGRGAAPGGAPCGAAGRLFQANVHARLRAQPDDRVEAHPQMSSIFPSQRLGLVHQCGCVVHALFRQHVNQQIARLPRQAG